MVRACDELEAKTDIHTRGKGKKKTRETTAIGE
jgi:hypothetical protein